MSTRALRRAQRELEEKKQLEQAEADHTEDESDDEVDLAPVQTKGPSMFALLGTEDGQDEDGDEDEADVEAEVEPPTPDEVRQAKATTSSKKKKKKKKGKARNDGGGEPENLSQGTKSAQLTEQLDEIDLALRSLSTKDSKSQNEVSKGQSSALDAEQIELYRLLSIDTQHLHAANEMRRLFGRAAFEQEDDEGGQRRRGNQHGGLAGAVAGRPVPGGRNLASLGLRKNIFVQGKEEWPRATLGGLGMEVVEKRDDGTVEYRFVHNTSYQDIQRQFKVCVASLDPERMIQLLQYNPFHISTLLQVSEIAKHERDRAVAGDLLERALFAFGRAVHSTFSTNLSQGKARLDFRRPENREFWLAAWRYIGVLGQRATWRTAFEWAKLPLSLSPDRDPYCISLVIDQLALRGRQPQDLIDLWNSKHFHSRWHRLPNISMSVGLAYIQSSDPSLGRPFLKDAIEQYPWVAMRLIQELDLQPIPPSVWGKQARSDTENLFTELYVTKAKDIWNTPEATSLLMEVASGAEPKSSSDVSIYTDFDELDYTRHVLLTDDQNLIALLDRRLTSSLSSVSDPLPPRDDLPSYSTDAPSSATRSAAGTRTLGNAREMLAELSSLQNFFRGILPWFPAAGEDGQAPINPATGMPPTQEDMARNILDSGIDPETFRERTDRMQELQQGIQQLLVDAELQEEDVNHADGGDNEAQ